MYSMKKIVIGVSTALLASVLPSQPAGAAIHTSTTGATDACNGALPGFEGALRKRPLGIANEGTGNAFVSCNAVVDEGTSNGTEFAALLLVNRNTEAVAVSCTFVDGLVPEYYTLAGSPDAPTYYPKLLAIAPGAAAVVGWTASEFSLETFSPIGSFSCNLPPAVEINLISVSWDDGVV